MGPSSSTGSSHFAQYIEHTITPLTITMPIKWLYQWQFKSIITTVEHHSLHFTRLQKRISSGVSTSYSISTQSPTIRSISNGESIASNETEPHTCTKCIELFE